MKMIGQEQCDGTDCGGGWYCNDPDYPVCCPDYDIFSNWSAVDADCCPQSSKILPKMAAKKNLVDGAAMIQITQSVAQKLISSQLISGVQLMLIPAGSLKQV